MGYDDPNSQAVEKVGLKEYDQLVEDASKGNNRRRLLL